MKERTIDRCSGCKACENACPKHCLVINGSGFDLFKEQIDEKRCIGCGGCKEVCPQLNPSPLYRPMIGYNVWSRNKYVARLSASGGVAASLYKKAISNAIHCIGVCYDEEMRLNYEFVQDTSDIQRFSGSKYVYSDMKDIYKKIRERVDNREKVLFIGMPCHVAGLRNVIGNNRFLYTVDIMCDGIPMYDFFKLHCNRILSERDASSMREVAFRRNDNQYGFTALDENGNVFYKKSRYRDEYMISFLHEINYCSACYTCPYACENRPGDMTIMDCSLPKEYTIRRERIFFGASQLLVNNEKGQQLWNLLVEKDDVGYETYPISEMIRMEKRMQYPSRGERKKKQLLRIAKIIGLERAVRVLYPLEPLKEVYHV